MNDARTTHSHKLAPGSALGGDAASAHYGIELAKASSLPAEVTEMAEEIAAGIDQANGVSERV